MGQRLNIEVVSDGNRLANAYYHWSAYTSSAIELTMMALDALEKQEDDQSNVQTAINILEATGARINPTEHFYVMRDDHLKEYKYKVGDKDVNRNDGLLSVTKSGMDDTERWEEGRVTIDIADNRVNFDVANIYCEWEYRDDEDGWWTEIFEDVDEVEFDFDNIAFSEITRLKRLIFEHPNGIKYNTILGWVVVRWVE